MSLFSYFFRPPEADSEVVNPHALAIRSKHAAIDAVEKSKESLARAESRLADAQDKYDDADSWNDQRVLAKAEEGYEDALIEHENNELKLAWENRGEWCRRMTKELFEIAKVRTKELLARIDWDRLRPLRNLNDN